jgi:hypothetical protein
MSRKYVPNREILFTAKMGFLSKALWLKFFTKRSSSRNSRLWNRFIEDEYFKPHSSKMLPDVLVLGDRSIKDLEKTGVLSVTKPHLGQFDHDEKVADILLSLERNKALRSYTTEAELKRKNWLWMKVTQDGRDTKLPDLTLELSGSAKFCKVALEIEQSKKSFDRYKKVMNSYATRKEIDVVIFIANQQSIFNSLSRAMKEVSYPSWERPIGFGELEAWLKDPLRAPIYLSRATESIEQWTSQKQRLTG